MERVAIRNLWVLMATAFVDMMGSLLLVPLVPFYAKRLADNPELVPLVVSGLASVYFVAQVITAPYWGRLSDRWGRRPVILTGLLVSAVAFVVFGLADSLWLLFVSRFVQGAAGGTTGVVQAYVSDVAAPEDRAKALGWVSAATSLGVMIGPVLGSVAIRFGEAAPGFLAAAICLVNAAFAWRWLQEPPRREARAVRGGPRPSVVAATWRVVQSPGTALHRLIWIYALGMMAFMAMNSMLALFLAERFGVTEQSVGNYYAYVGGISVVIRAFLLGPLVKRFGEVRTMRVGALSMCAGMVAVALVGQLTSVGVLARPWSLVALGLAVVFIPAGTAFLFPATTSQTSARAPREETGLTLGVQQTFGGIARVFGPLWAGVAFSQLGAPAPFLVGAVVMAVVFLLGLQIQPLNDPTKRTAVVQPEG